MEGMGEGKLYFLPLKSLKRKKGPLGKEVFQLVLSPIVVYRHSIQIIENK